MGLQWKSRAYLADYKFRRLKYITNFAYNNTRFYRSLYDSHGIKPGRIRSYSGFERLPTISRLDIIANYPHNITTKIRENSKSSTSGSSGTPLEIAFDSLSRNHYDAIFARAMFGAGYKLGNKLAFFHWKNRPLKWHEKLGIFHKDILSMSERSDIILKRLEHLKPHTMYCFASHFKILFEQMKETGKFISPRTIIITGDSVSPSFKREIKETLSCNILEQYAMTEFEVVAWECKEGGYHINDDSVHLETGKGKEVLLSSLWNKKMPLIRYETGDMAHLSHDSCDCGRGLNMINRLDGRKDDIIRIGNVSVSPAVLSAYVETGDEFYRYVRQYKVIQNGKNITFQFVERHEPSEEFITVVTNRLKKLIGNVNIKVKKVNCFKINRRGKFKTVEVK